jgi:hypothetical protein
LNTFGAVLFEAGKPSQSAPWNSLGTPKRILIMPSVVRKCLRSIVNKPLWAPAKEYGPGGLHDKKHQLGTITEARLVGSMVYVEGTLKKDEISRTIEVAAGCNTLGISFDSVKVHSKFHESRIAIIDHITFVGATVMPQELAAFKTDCLFWID